MVSNLHEEREGRVGNVGRRMISIDDKSIMGSFRIRIREGYPKKKKEKRIDISDNQRNNESSECMHVFILLFDEMSPAIITTKNTRKISY
mmetsp:Transcript_4532/g.10895  ORF Transcript_4532/g.10895 Transcript_4532/m.10895 type:complete len:90 (+) Transcript_4532:1101-1370(+)